MPDLPVPDSRSPELPVGPAARERVVEILTRLFADDQITQADLEARLERVYRAASTDELQAIVADLPSSLPATTAPQSLEPAGRISALLSGQEQRITGVVPRQLEVRGRLGYVELDLTQATFEQGVTRIDVRAFMGYVQVRLPAGVRVECHGRALAGFFSLKGASNADAASPSVVQVVGRATFGFAECLVGKAKARSLSRRLPAGD